MGNIRVGLFTILPNETSWVGLGWTAQGGQMEEGHLIHVTAFNPGEYTVYKAPVPGKENMFWVWEDENWFLPIIGFCLSKIERQPHISPDHY